MAKSEHINLKEYAAIEQNENQYLYMSVNGNILNGITVPAFGAKSMPDMKTGSTGQTEPTGVSNQESLPLPELNNEDTIYVLIDTDNNYLTGYSSIGMTIGAEKMIEIKGHYGIITLRVIKEWTGSVQNEWEWTDGGAINAAAKGNELELETVEGAYWIHIVGWDGDQDTSIEFQINKDIGRYADDVNPVSTFNVSNTKVFDWSCLIKIVGFFIWIVI
jgi:hypothetical protein